MTNNELIETAKQAMKDLSATNMLEHEQTAYNCLRLFCERLGPADSFAKKWKALGDDIAVYYEQEKSEEHEEGDLIAIGEVAATAFGYM